MWNRFGTVLIIVSALVAIASCSSARATNSSPAAAPASGQSGSPTANSAPAPTTEPAATNTTQTSLAGNAENGKKLFPTLPCSSCHDVTKPFPGGDICPNLGNIATMAAQIVKSSDYHGQAKDAAGYIHESIVNPNAYIVPGAKYRSASGQSVMPKSFGQTLTPSQIDDLVAYLMTLK